MYGDDDSETDHRFEQAFAAVDPEPLLLQILKDHPFYITVRDLAIYYVEAVEENPSRGGYLASVLVKVAESPEAPLFTPDTVSSFIDRTLADHHFKVIYGDHRVKDYGPKNTYLLDSFLSGLSFKYSLTSTSDQLAAIHEGLDAACGSSESEILVVGTCIQLLLHGSELVTERAGTYRRSPEELAISLADTGFKPENDRDDVWSLLFPPKA
ncbi:hypothetical protein CPB84DRAFT_1786860 [Gymnopilus junonius]|uniref:Uncharacterized protein n=1 Tax=Gymnopilus junonius TaxID=109634 RepID=A0A9P5NH28_GYMJU|nr:hypothetical protein CPB84DRAFT_1786860 [Gymnopilus junonius]